MKPFDRYDITPCERFNGSGERDPNGKCYMVCEDHEAHVWTLLGLVDGEPDVGVGEFASRERAEEVYQRITGKPWSDGEDGPELLSVLQAAEGVIQWAIDHGAQSEHVLKMVRKAIAAATSEAE
jgi:hypothetical protein